MKYSNIPTAQAIVQQCKANTLCHVVISPGSRNAPLTISFTRDPFFSCYSIVDERAAAFFALGMAKFLKQPVVLLCSSGSALLNYYPAISEAFYSQIPLIVISADRPTYRIDVGDGQTIQQQGVYASHTVAAVNLLQDVSHASDTIARESDLLEQYPTQEELLAHNLKALEEGFFKMLLKKGPLHINVPFEEPLYELDEALPLEVIAPTKLPDFPVEPLEDFAKQWNNAKKKMILVGTQDPNCLSKELLSHLIEDDSVIILTENTSNLHHSRLFSSIDQLIAPIEKSADEEGLFQKLKPEILLTFGGMVVSKKIKAFLRTYQPNQHWHVDPTRAYNTYFCLSHHFKSTISDFVQALLPNLEAQESDYFSFWNTIKQQRVARHKLFMQQATYSDLKVFDCIERLLPSRIQLQMANSSTIRYAQLFNFHPDTVLYCNRGTSGIDGCTSTAIGSAVYDQKPTILITGDLSFLYDSNGLWNNYIPNNFKIVILNNQGGGIFRILPSAKDQEHFETFFETAHPYTGEHLARMYGFLYWQVSDIERLEEVWGNFIQEENQACILEVMTPREENDEVLRAYFKFLV